MSQTLLPRSQQLSVLAPPFGTLSQSELETNTRTPRIPQGPERAVVPRDLGCEVQKRNAAESAESNELIANRRTSANGLAGEI
jgi:hypothetical protein